MRIPKQQLQGKLHVIKRYCEKKLMKVPFFEGQGKKKNQMLKKRKKLGKLKMLNGKMMTSNSRKNR